MPVSTIKTPLTGSISDWNSERGFGFVESDGQRIFLHMKDFKERHKIPEVGDVIQFELGSDKQGRPCAQKARHTNDGGRFTSENILFTALLLVAPICAIVRLSRKVPVEYVASYWLMVSACTYFVYAWDKERARNKKARTPETLMHFWELLGGWPGGFVAQRRLRHKCTKLSYQIFFWVIVAGYQFVSIDYVRNWTMTLRATHEIQRALGGK